MNTRLLWITLALVLVGGIGYQLHASSHRSVATQTSSATGSSSSSVSSSSTSVTSVNGKTNIEITVSYTVAGFSPDTINTNIPAKLIFKNQSGTDLVLDSNPHPTHTECPVLNVGTIPAGKSKTIELTATANCGFHNHLHPSHTGKLNAHN